MLFIGKLGLQKFSPMVAHSGLGPLNAPGPMGFGNPNTVDYILLAFLLRYHVDQCHLAWHLCRTSQVLGLHLARYFAA